ncbi:MAG: hypothetical protein GX207_03645 [Peptococcaceae bacterium]|nr:hypothetical protein [Peptococcaceae bacterium]
MDIFQAFDNAFGGHDFQIDNEMYQTRENLIQGQDIYKNGKLVASTKPNMFGGVDMFNSQNEVIVSTHENVMGGQGILSGNGESLGFTTQDAMGTTFHDHSGALSMHLEQGNASTILNYQDPLAHVDSYVLPTLIL